MKTSKVKQKTENFEKLVLFFRCYISLFLFSLFTFNMSSCSLSGKITSRVNSQKDNFGPVRSPVSGSDQLKFNEPSEYINLSNESNYSLTGTCQTTGFLTIELNGVISRSDVSCVGAVFSTIVNTTSIASGVVSIRIYDPLNAGIESTVSVVKDTVSPSLIGSVTDGSYNNSTTQTSTLTWIAGSDAHSGIGTYEVAIGTAPGGNDVLIWTETASTNASHIQGGITLVEGTQYYASIRAKDRAGNISSEILSDGWVVDVTAPSLATSFTDGGEINFSTTSSKLLSWAASNDVTSGLSGYEISIGTTSGGTDVMSWTSVGNVLAEQIDGLTLFGNRRYYASIRSVDAAGNKTASVLSDGWWNLRQSKKAVDSTNPQGRWFADGILFGSDISISEDGNIMVIGAYNDTTDADGLNPIFEAGAVYVYVKSSGSWVFQQKLVATGTNARIASDKFGFRVSISGETIVVGAVEQDYNESGGNSVSNAGAAYVFTRTAGVWSQQQKLVATGTNARMASDSFGFRVAISGETLVVGAKQSYDESGGSFLYQAGAAYVFTRTAGVWSQQQKLVATGTNARIASDSFGSSSLSISGETIVVGATGQDYDESGGNSGGNAGAAYVFTRTAGVWSQQQKLVATGTNARMPMDFFGYSVAISGETLVVGAHWQYYDESGGNSVNNAGAAYVFTRTAGVWSQQQKLVATGTNARIASDTFGSSVSISGETIVVGAAGQDYDASGGSSVSDAGAAYVFIRTAGVWSQQQKLVATGTNARMVNDRFGSCVAISGETITIGVKDQDYDSNGENQLSNSGAIFSYDRSLSNWSLTQRITDGWTPIDRADLASDIFGGSIAISEDGSTLVVASVNDNTDANNSNYISSSGAVYVYVKSSGSWVFQQKLVATGTNARIASDRFGMSVSVSGDTIVVGAVEQDYNESGGNSVSNAGAAYVFTRTAGVWSQQQKLVATGTNARMASDSFGFSVAISGETIVVGAYNQNYDASGGNSVGDAGAAYVFTRTTGVWSQQQKLVATGSNARIGNDNFGSSVSISGDTIVVGASAQDYDESGGNSVGEAGAAYVFTRTAGVWSQQQKLVATGTNARIASDMLGSSVSISGETIVVGAEGQDYDASGGSSVSDAGAAYVFTRTAGVWSQQQKLVATGTNARMVSDSFGSSVAISGDTVVVGGAGQDYDTSGGSSVSDAGAAYVYHRSGTIWAQELKLIPTGTNSRIEDAHFGFGVCISENSSADGFTIGVGVPGDTFDSVGGGSSVSGAGSVFIFD